MVSNAADMSIPVIFIFMFSVTVFAASHLWVQTTSEVLRSGLKPLLLCDRYFSMLGLILSSVSKESTFLKVLRSVIGLKLFGGPLGLLGFGMAIRTPELMSSSSWFADVLFNMFVIVWSRRGVEYFSSSGYIWSSPGALLFLSRLRFFLISACVIGWLSGFGFPIKDGISGVLISLNLFSNGLQRFSESRLGLLLVCPRCLLL